MPVAFATKTTGIITFNTQATILLLIPVKKHLLILYQ